METGQSPSAEGLPLETEILTTRVEYLKPSDLPPPATYYGTFSSSTEWSDDSSSEDDQEGISSIWQRLQYLPRTLNSASPYDPMELDELSGNNEISELNESDTSSIDILAQAREIDPDAVAAKERQYEEETSSPQLAEKSPSGISAQTTDSVDGTSSPAPRTYQ